MAAPFAFIPRKVAAIRASSGKLATESLAAESSALPSANTHPPSKQSTQLSDVNKKQTDSKVKPSLTQSKFSDRDCAILVSLALSDHALWADPDLRRTIEQSNENFIALRYLFRRSKILALAGFGKGAKPDDKENLVFRALRALHNDKIDIRMILSEPSDGQDAGLYEIRRKDWETAHQGPRQSYSREQWESRTVYMENIPLPNRSVAGIASLASSLLSETQEISLLSFDRVQNVILPPHQQDGPDDLPQCKGFGLVVLADPEDVETMLGEWPWTSSKTASVRSDPARADNQDRRAAQKFGLRTLPKRRWDELKEEYLAYQKRMLDELVAFNDESYAAPAATVQTPAFEQPHSDATRYEYEEPVEPPPTAQGKTTLESEFPLNCLAFVRNIHAETNKTALRKLFNVALDTASAKSNGLDYVDYVKGADTCYLRFTAPHYTQLVLEHFVGHPTIQSSGLDDIGIPGMAEGCINVEIVQGKKEGVYWEKVPEKVRWKAVEMAVNAQQASLNDSATQVPDQDNGKARKRKRAK